MAKGKRKRGGDAKLRVIAGGAAPKAVVTKRAPASSSPPSADARPKLGPPNLRRAVEQQRVEVANDTADSAPEVRASAVARVTRKSPFPRALILGGLVVALGGAAYALTRNSIEPKPAAPIASVAPTEWPSTPVSAIASEAVSVAAPPPASATESAAPSVSASAPASVSASASAPAPASVPAPASASAAPKPAPPKPAAPKPADDDPYQ